MHAKGGGAAPSLNDGFIVYEDRHESESAQGVLMIKKEFYFLNGGDLLKFLADIANDGWIVNNDETYFLDGITTVYVAYK